eukprot:scaffold73085_cov63-Phaeocystis_antarctica.AAC.5
MFVPQLINHPRACSSFASSSLRCPDRRYDVHDGRAPARAGSARRWTGSLAWCSRELLARRGGHEGLRLEGQGRTSPGAGDDHAWLSEAGARVAPEEDEEGTGRVRRAGRDVRLW